MTIKEYEDLIRFADQIPGPGSAIEKAHAEARAYGLLLGRDQAPVNIQSQRRDWYGRDLSRLRVFGSVDGKG